MKKMTKRRKNMLPEERRNQLLDCAQSLFFSKGYDAATIRDIMEMANVSKGGFYHHFTSKEELMVGILSRFVERSEAAFQPVLAAKNMTALERYNLYFEILRSQQTPATLAPFMQIVSALLRDENALLQARLTEDLVRTVVPTFAAILQQGIDEGVFKIENAEAAASLIVRIGNHHQNTLKAAFDAQSETELELASEKTAAMLKMQGIAIDRLLGLPDGTTALRDGRFVEAFVEGVRAERFSQADKPEAQE